jgi:hypothetical protein
MKLSEEIRNNINSYSDRHLDRLATLLNYEISSLTLYFLSYLVKVLLFGAIIAAIIFTPYMIFVLFREKKYNWLIFFFLFIICPLITIEFFIVETNVKLFLRTIPWGLFFIYCLLLKFSVNDWIREREWKRVWEMQKLEKEEKLKSELL